MSRKSRRKNFPSKPTPPQNVVVAQGCLTYIVYVLIAIVLISLVLIK